MLACKTDEVILGLEVEAWMLTNASFSFLALFLFFLLERRPNGKPDVTLPRIRFALIAILMVDHYQEGFDVCNIQKRL